MRPFGASYTLFIKGQKDNPDPQLTLLHLVEKFTVEAEKKQVLMR